MRTIRGLARFVVFAGAIALSGCVTAQNPLSQNDIAAMKLTGVTVNYAPDAYIQWDDGIREYAASKGIAGDDMAAATNTPEGKAYVRAALAQRIKGGVESAGAGKLNGTRPVRLDVAVHNFHVSPAVQRIVLGGNHGLTADATLVDARTGAVILAYPNLSVDIRGGAGVIGAAVEAAMTNGGETTLGRVVDKYSASYFNWLLQRA